MESKEPKSEVPRLGASEVLQKYFGATSEEIRKMPPNERKELAREAAKQLGVELLE